MPQKISSRCDELKEFQTVLIRESALPTYACFPETGPLLALLPFFVRLLSHDEGKPGAEDGKQYKLQASRLLSSTWLHT
jgi:hypothetical protein